MNFSEIIAKVMADAQSSLEAQLKNVSDEAYAKGLSDGKAQSPDLGAAIAADHAALAKAVSDIIGKDLGLVQSAFAAMASEVNAAIVPLQAPPAPPSEPPAA